MKFAELPAAHVSVLGRHVQAQRVWMLAVMSVSLAVSVGLARPAFAGAAILVRRPSFLR